MNSPNPLEKPYDISVERMILGNCLLAESIAPLGDLQSQEFFSDRHKLIVEALRSLDERKIPINLIELDRYFTQGGNSTRPQTSYLAELPDGALPFTDKTAAFYHGRIRSLASERNLLKEAESLGQAAGHGATVTDIRDAAEKLLEKTKPAAEKAVKLLYSKVPEEAWHEAAKVYRAAVGHSTEASDNYHLASFLLVVGNLLGKSVYVQAGRKTYPNLFTVLVGRAGGARKDTAIDMALDFALDTDAELHVPSSLDSRQGWIQGMADFQKQQREQMKLFGTLRSILRLTELRSLIEAAEQKHLSGIIPELNKAYDCKLALENNVRNNPVSIKDHCISLLAATAPGWMKTLKESDLESGLGSRLLFVPGDPKPPMAEPDPPNSIILNPLKGTIREIVDHYRTLGTTKLKFSETARKLWHDFYNRHTARAKEDDLVAILSERDHTNCLKVALIYAALDQAGTIEEKHLKAAIAFTEFVFEARFPLFKGYGVPFYAEQEQKILEAVRATGPNGIGKRALQHRFWKLSAEVFNRRLKALCLDDGPLTHRWVGRKLYIVPN